jgi:hypothetical protein
MSATAGQAAGLAVGAAVGSIIPGVGTIAGAAIGSATAGFIGETSANSIQTTLDQATLNLNREQARLKAAETAAIHASNFRQALASQVSIASMRGGSGSVAAQFGQASYENFLRDQKAIEAGLTISEAQSDITQAGITAKKESRDLIAATRFAQNALTGVNLNLTKPRSTSG